MGLLVLFWHFQLVTSLARWHDSLSSLKQNRCWNNLALLLSLVMMTTTTTTMLIIMVAMMTI